MTTGPLVGILFEVLRIVNYFLKILLLLQYIQSVKLHY